MQRAVPLWRSYENRLLAVLTFTFGIVFLDRAAVLYLAPFIAHDLRLNNVQIGALAGALSVTWAVSGVVVSRVCDSLGRQRTILSLSILLFSVCSVLSGLAGSFGLLLAARLLMGVFEGPTLPISQALLSRESSGARRGLNMGVMQQFGSNILGTFIAPILLIFIAGRYGWRDAFFVAGIPGLFCALLVWRFVRDPDPAHGKGQRLAFPLRAALRYRNIPLCMAIASLALSQAAVCFVFLPLYFVRVDGFSSQTMSFLISTLGVSAVVGSLLTPALSDRFGRRPIIIIMTITAFVLPLGVSMVGRSPVALGVALFLGFLSTGAAPLIMATIPAETLPSPHVASVIGLVIGTAELVAALTGPLLGGVVADRFGLPAVIWLQMAFLMGMLLLSCFLIETAPSLTGTPAASKRTLMQFPSDGER